MSPATSARTSRGSAARAGPGQPLERRVGLVGDGPVYAPELAVIGKRQRQDGLIRAALAQGLSSGLQPPRRPVIELFQHELQKWERIGAGGIIEQDRVQPRRAGRGLIG